MSGDDLIDHDKRPQSKYARGVKTAKEYLTFLGKLGYSKGPVKRGIIKGQYIYYRFIIYRYDRAVEDSQCDHSETLRFLCYSYIVFE